MKPSLKMGSITVRKYTAIEEKLIKIFGLTDLAILITLSIIRIFSKLALRIPVFREAP